LQERSTGDKTLVKYDNEMCTRKERSDHKIMERSSGIDLIFGKIVSKLKN